MFITHLNFAKGFRGGERQTQLLIESLAQHNYKQRLLVRVGSELTKRCKDIKNLEIIEITKPYIFHISQLKGSTLLHAHETKALQFAYFAHILTGIEYIVTRRVDNSIKQNFLNKKLYENAKFVVALSNAIKATVQEITQNAKIMIIPSAFTPTQVNIKKTQQIKERFATKFLLGHIGALDDKHKGQTLLIELAKKFENKRSDIHFLLVGGGDDEKMLKEMAQGLSNITFEGFVNNVNDYIAAFDIFVFPSRNEGLGSILLDVMYHNTPIVASRVGGIVDIIQENENGLLFEGGNSEDLEQKVVQLYKNETLRTQLAQNAKKTIHNYSVEKMTQSYISLYEI